MKRPKENGYNDRANHLERHVKPEVTKAVILVGGWGTRLRPLTYTVPKPLISFCNRPILKYQIEKLVKAGIREVILALNYYSEKIMKEVENYQEEFEIKIIYSKEDEPLGTAGPLALARSHLEGTSFFVLNSDIACNADLSEMKKDFMKSDAIGTILVYEVEDPTKYGLIRTEGSRIKSFLEKPKKMEGAGPWIINAGIYILSHEILQHIELREVSIEKEVFPKLAELGVLDAFKFEGYWMDIGQPVDYLKGQRLAIRNMETSDVFPNEIDATPSSRSESSEELDGSINEGYIDRKNNVVIGRNVKIGSNVNLKDCTLFENTVVEDNVTVENSIVGWGSRLQKNCKIMDFCVLGEGTIVEGGSYLRGCRTEPNSKV